MFDIQVLSYASVLTEMLKDKLSLDSLIFQGLISNIWFVSEIPHVLSAIASSVLWLACPPPSLMTPVKGISSRLTLRQSKWDSLEEFYIQPFCSDFGWDKCWCAWKSVYVGGGRNLWEEIVLKTSRCCLHICSVISKHSLFLPCLSVFSPSIPFFSSAIYCQEGPRLKGQFSTAWHQHRRMSTPVPTVSQFAIGILFEMVLVYVHVEAARILQKASRTEGERFVSSSSLWLE